MTKMKERVENTFSSKQETKAIKQGVAVYSASGRPSAFVADELDKTVYTASLETGRGGICSNFFG